MSNGTWHPPMVAPSGSPYASPNNPNAMAQFLRTQAPRPTDASIGTMRRQQARAMERGNQEMPTGRMVGDRYVPVNPLAVLGKTLGNLGNQRKERRLEKSITKESEAQQLYDRAASQAAAEQDSARFGMKMDMDREQMEATNALKEANMENTQAWRDLTHSFKVENKILDSVQKMSKQLEPVLTTQTAMRNFDEKIAPYMEGGINEGLNVPGIGLLEGDPSLIGQTVRLLQDFRQPGNPNAEMYASFRAVMNQMIKQDAGLQQTIHEMRNQLVALGMTGLEDEEVALIAYPDLRDRQNVKVQNIMGAYSPDVVERYAGYRDPITPLRSFGEINAEAAQARQQQTGWDGKSNTATNPGDGSTWVEVAPGDWRQMADPAQSGPRGPQGAFPQTRMQPGQF